MTNSISESVARDSESSKEFLLLFGSQLGSSEAIAHEIRELTEANGLQPTLLCTDQVLKYDLNVTRTLVLVISSTGDGEPPDNARTFLRNISVGDLYPKRLAHLRYALLGLGDSNYSTYHGCPLDVQKRLLALGALPFCDIGLADDATGLELVVEPWIEELLPALQSELYIAHYRTLPVIQPINTIDQSAISSPLTNSNQPINQLESILEKMTLNSNNSDEQESHSKLKTCVTDCQCEFAKDGSIRYGNEEFWAKNQDLRVPLLASAYVKVDMDTESAPVPMSSVVWQNGAAVVGAQGERIVCQVVSNQSITRDHPQAIAKPKWEIRLKSNDLPEYQPGDAFYFIFPNPKCEVDFIINRLGLSTCADQPISLSLISQGECESKTAPNDRALPVYLPVKCSITYLLTFCLDIRRAPGRPLLRVLAEYCSEAVSKSAIHDRHRLLQLSSSQELLPRLLPRPFSVSNSPLVHPNELRFVYSCLSFACTQGGRFYERKGLCTDWLTQRRKGEKVLVLYKEPNNFRLPVQDAVHKRMILIGPGTGLAPFLGFLQQFSHEMEQLKLPPRSIERWVFFGCRQLNTDFIYEEELESHVRSGVLTDLHVCESRPAAEGRKGRYVQDALKSSAHRIVSLVCDEEQAAYVYVCGDAVQMCKQVMLCFIQIIANVKDVSEQEAREIVMNMKKEGRYIEDVWT